MPPDQIEETTSSHEDLTAVLAEAFDATENEQGTVAADAPAEEPAHEGPRRGPDGKFAPREEAPAVAAAPAELEETTWEDRPPSSWKPAVREAWATLPEPVRKEILRREEASVVGIRQMQERLEPYSVLADNVAPYMSDIAEKGGDPVQYTKQLLDLDKRMRYAPNPQQKLAVLLHMADAYGVPLRQALSGQEMPAPAPQSTIPPQIARELAEIRQWRQQMVSSSAANEVESFGADKEFFNDVRGRMADLIEAGAAADIAQAYDMACWADPEVRAVLLQRERGQAGQQQLSARQKAAAGASLPAGNAISVPADDNDGDDIGSILRSEFTRQAGGRI